MWISCLWWILIFWVSIYIFGLHKMSDIFSWQHPRDICNNILLNMCMHASFCKLSTVYHGEKCIWRKIVTYLECLNFLLVNAFWQICYASIEYVWLNYSYIKKDGHLKFFYIDLDYCDWVLQHIYSYWYKSHLLTDFFPAIENIQVDNTILSY